MFIFNGIVTWHEVITLHPLFTFKFTYHVIATNFAYEEISVIFLTRKPILRRERWKRNTYVSLNQFIFEHHQSLTAQRIVFKSESKLIYMLCHLGGSPFNLWTFFVTMYVPRKCVVNIYAYGLLMRDNFNKRTFNV